MTPMMKLFEQVEALLPHLLCSPDLWSTLDIEYDTPRVERVWMQLGAIRVLLHVIHPCKEALMHPHPWPSVVKIVSGEYEMGVSSGPTGEGDVIPDPAAIVTLKSGSYYEMSNPQGWHYVKPSAPSMSLMITGTPWPSQGRHSPGKGQNSRGLSKKRQDEIMLIFRQIYSEYNE